jgi:parvulin-like peptidyl-prolyl isomerase
MAIKPFALLLSFVSVLFVVSPLLAADDKGGEKAKTNPANDSAPKPLDYIAIVGGEKISMGSYISALRRGMRERFYHGKIPEEEARQFRKEVADQLIERLLLIQEATRRNLKPNAEEVEAAVRKFDEKFKGDAEWEKARDQVLVELRKKLNGDSLAKVLKESVHSVPEPTKRAVRAYYEEHKDLFTTPERVSISLILLRVDPSSPSEVWQQANEEASSILERINGGADFAELARIHSSDESAQNGGDMGFVHAGMLGVNAQKVLDILEPGEISAPVVLLEGVSIFRMDKRETAKLNDFNVVKERAGKLYKRDKGDRDWKELRDRLHKETVIEVNDAPWR